eukprot:scaffold3.g6505.t1
MQVAAPGELAGAAAGGRCPRPLPTLLSSTPATCAATALARARLRTLKRVELSKVQLMFAVIALQEVMGEQAPSTTGRKIVFAVDGTAPCQQALAWVARNALQKVGSMDCATQFAPAQEEARYAKQYLQRLEGDAARMLQERFAPQLAVAPPGVRSEPLLLRLKLHKSAGGIGEALCTKAADLGADLVLIASHGAGVLADYGSVARWCSENSRVPALLLPPFTEDPSPASSTPSSALVVAGADNLPGLRAAFDFALAKLARPGDSVYVLHALYAPPAGGGGGGDGPEVAARKQLVASVGRWQDESGAAAAPAVNVACDVLFAADGPLDSAEPDASAVGAALVERVEQLNARSVVFVHHGNSMAREMQYGPITLHLTKHCTRPLVVTHSINLPAPPRRRQRGAGLRRPPPRAAAAVAAAVRPRSPARAALDFLRFCPAPLLPPMFSSQLFVAVHAPVRWVGYLP